MLVASTVELLAQDRGDLWDSGRVASDQTLHVVYAGQPLKSGQQVWWKVRAWDGGGRAAAWSRPATWTMGLLEASDWKARWIEAPVEPAPPVPGHNGYHSGWAKSPDTRKWVAVDLGEPRRIDAVVLHPARPWDWPDTPGFLFPVRFRVEVSDAADFKQPQTVVDQSGQDVANPGTKPLRFSFAPATVRHVRVFVTRLASVQPEKFAFALSQLEVLGGDRNWALGKPVTAADEQPGSWSRASLVDGIVLPRRPDPGQRQPAALSAQAVLPGGPGAAGGGASVGVGPLPVANQRPDGRRKRPAPEWTDYHTRVQYQTHDVTGMLQDGENVLGAIVGDGWYAGRIGLAGIVPNGPAWGIYGLNPRLLVQLEVQFRDGTRSVIATDASWRVSLDGPIRENDILDGEVHDARKAQPGWDRSGFSDSATVRRRVSRSARWSPDPAETADRRSPEPVLSGPLSGSAWLPAKVVEHVAARLVAQPNEPIRVVKELHAGRGDASPSRACSCSTSARTWSAGAA